jgi:hypothetical protein
MQHMQCPHFENPLSQDLVLGGALAKLTIIL